MQAPLIFTDPPRWIPRAEMPQIDAADLSALMEWLAFRGVAVSPAVIPAKALRFHQRINWRRVHDMPADVYAKPILVSKENWILDGNHRAAAHKLKGEACFVLVLDCGFNEAIDMLFSFAGTYDYATSGNPAAIRN